MTQQLQEISDCLEPISQALQADGAVPKLSEVKGTILVARLVLRDESCRECLLPADEIEFMVLDLLREDHEAITGFQLHIDPSEA